MSMTDPEPGPGAAPELPVRYDGAPPAEAEVVECEPVPAPETCTLKLPVVGHMLWFPIFAAPTAWFDEVRRAVRASPKAPPHFYLVSAEFYAILAKLRPYLLGKVRFVNTEPGQPDHGWVLRFQPDDSPVEYEVQLPEVDYDQIVIADVLVARWHPPVEMRPRRRRRRLSRRRVEAMGWDG